jgi:hypothetical protein
MKWYNVSQELNLKNSNGEVMLTLLWNQKVTNAETFSKYNDTFKKRQYVVIQSLRENQFVFYMNHRRSKHSLITWTEINRVGPTPVDLESTDYFTLSFNPYPANVENMVSF